MYPKNKGKSVIRSQDADDSDEDQQPLSASAQDSMTTLAMRDLGQRRQDEIATAEVGRRGHQAQFHQSRINAARECNRDGTEAANNAQANRVQTNLWNNLHNTDDANDEGPADFHGGQSHRTNLHRNRPANGGLEPSRMATSGDARMSLDAARLTTSVAPQTCDVQQLSRSRVPMYRSNPLPLTTHTPPFFSERSNEPRIIRRATEDRTLTAEEWQAIERVYEEAGLSANHILLSDACATIQEAKNQLLTKKRSHPSCSLSSSGPNSKRPNNSQTSTSLRPVAATPASRNRTPQTNVLASRWAVDNLTINPVAPPARDTSIQSSSSISNISAAAMTTSVDTIRAYLGDRFFDDKENQVPSATPHLSNRPPTRQATQDTNIEPPTSSASRLPLQRVSQQEPLSSSSSSLEEVTPHTPRPVRQSVSQRTRYKNPFVTTSVADIRAALGPNFIEVHDEEENEEYVASRPSFMSPPNNPFSSSPDIGSLLPHVDNTVAPDRDIRANNDGRYDDGSYAVRPLHATGGNGEESATGHASQDLLGGEIEQMEDLAESFGGLTIARSSTVSLNTAVASSQDTSGEDTSDEEVDLIDFSPVQEPDSAPEVENVSSSMNGASNTITPTPDIAAQIAPLAYNADHTSSIMDALESEGSFWETQQRRLASANPFAASHVPSTNADAWKPSSNHELFSASYGLRKRARK